ncbi:MAG: hypothetical protein K8T25_19690 [Planctomycetia bacterium]|nr:hypothetical protein [Planctomycetia bacterium]
MSKPILLRATLASSFIAAIFAGVILSSVPCHAQTPEELAKQRAPKPKEFGNVFSYGYAGDQMPKEPEKFDELLQKMKKLGFNVVHCTYTPERVAACQKNGVQMMVDLLSVEDHHIYRSADKAKAVCEKLRGNPAVWGYNIWNDPIGKMYAGRVRDINNVRTWDPTHPAYCGDGNGTFHVKNLSNADILGYYDFHWQRGLGKNLANLQTLLGHSRNFNANYYTWLAAGAGSPGDQNVRRTLWSVNSGLACGLKGILWFLATPIIDPKTLAPGPLEPDFIKINAQLMPLSAEIIAIGLPTAVYGSNVTKTLDDQPLPDGKTTMTAPGLTAVPADFWAQPTHGDVILGVFKNPAGQDALFVSNYNAYAPQQVTLKLSKLVKASMFSRKEGKYLPLEVKDHAISFPLEGGAGELIRFE